MLPAYSGREQLIQRPSAVRNPEQRTPTPRSAASHPPHTGHGFWRFLKRSRPVTVGFATAQRLSFMRDADTSVAPSAGGTAPLRANARHHTPIRFDMNPPQ